MDADDRRPGARARRAARARRSAPGTRTCSSGRAVRASKTRRAQFAAMLIGVGGRRARPAARRARACIPTSSSSNRAARRTASKDDVRERILPEAARAPIEGERKVLMLFEAERLRGNQNESANAMLKTLEEPPDRTVVVLVTVGARRSAADDPVALPAHRLRSRRRRRRSRPRSKREGVARRRRRGRWPRSRAASSRGRARSPDRSAALRAAFAAAPARVDGYGATALAIAQELDAAVDGRGRRQSTRRHAEELAEFDAEMERLGYSERDAQRLRRRIDDRHKRETRRTRIDLLLEGVTAIESVYRDALAAPAPALNADRPAIARRAARRRGRARRVPRGARGVPDQREGRSCASSRCSWRCRPPGPPEARRATLSSFAGVAQSVEQLTRNEQARGSSPLSGSTAVAGLGRYGVRAIMPASSGPSQSETWVAVSHVRWTPSGRRRSSSCG